jgi:hypothetical protein
MALKLSITQFYTTYCLKQHIEQLNYFYSNLTIR